MQVLNKIDEPQMAIRTLGIDLDLHMQYLTCLLAAEEEDLPCVLVYRHNLGADLRPVVELELEVEVLWVFEGLLAGVGAYLDEVDEEAVAVADLG